VARNGVAADTNIPDALRGNLKVARGPQTFIVPPRELST
jgi:hypothetical protein